MKWSRPGSGSEPHFDLLLVLCLFFNTTKVKYGADQRVYDCCGGCRGSRLASK